MLPDIEAFEERAAIAEYDGGLPRKNSEDLAAKGQEYWAWLAEYVVRERLPS
jgi:hypothetical protein